MRPEPQNDNQRAIAEAIDRKARIMAEELDRWDAQQIVSKMTAAAPNEWTAVDHEFFNLYLEWRSGVPI
jgi:hypothetical protein